MLNKNKLAREKIDITFFLHKHSEKNCGFVLDTEFDLYFKVSNREIET